MGMDDYMGRIEIDERGRITLPAKIREKLYIKPGDKLIIKIGSDNTIVIKKKPPKEVIFEKLVGCIDIPLKEKPSPESIKGIWKEKM